MNFWCANSSLSVDKNISKKRIWLNEEERLTIENKERMTTSKHVDSSIPYSTGLMVNQIFTNSLNGEKLNPNELRSSIESQSRNDKYSKV